MSRQTLRDRNQHVIGYIDVEFSGRLMSQDATRLSTPTTMSLVMETFSPLSYNMLGEFSIKMGESL